MKQAPVVMRWTYSSMSNTTRFSTSCPSRRGPSSRSTHEVADHVGVDGNLSAAAAAADQINAAVVHLDHDAVLHDGAGDPVEVRRTRYGAAVGVRGQPPAGRTAAHRHVERDGPQRVRVGQGG